MPTPLEADEYLSLDPTLSRDEARALADADNKTLGLRDLSPPTEPSAPHLPSTVASPQPGPTADGLKQIDRWTRQRMNGEINDYQWEREIDPKIQAILAGTNAPRYMSAQDQNFLANEIDARHTEDSIAAAIDSHMEPAHSPSDYRLRTPPQTPQQEQFASNLRESFFSAGVPTETGTNLIAHWEDNAKALAGATDQEKAEWVAREHAKVPPHRLEMVKRFMQEVVPRSPSLAYIADTQPETLNGANVINAVGFFLESRARNQLRQRQ